jgi:hypothetical protein
MGQQGALIGDQSVPFFSFAGLAQLLYFLSG